MQVPVFVIYLYAFVSFVTFLLYGVDKWQAKKDKRRIPEKWLHAFEFFGGWPGALVAQLAFRHKTAKISYQILFWLIVVIHLILWYLRFIDRI